MKFVDFHCDTLSRIYSLQKHKGNNQTLESNTGHVDLNRLLDSGTLLQCFACFVNLEDKPFRESHYKDVLEMIYLMKNTVDKNVKYKQINTIKDMETIENVGKLGCLLTVEEGELLSLIRND